MIPSKLFARLTDLDARVCVPFVQQHIEWEREFNRLADQVNWPWNASAEQREEWRIIHLYRRGCCATRIQTEPQPENER